MSTEIVQAPGLQAAPIFSEDLFTRWVSFLDASEKTIQTYSRAISRFLGFLRENGITQPTRETVIAYKTSLAADHKATTVSSYLAAVRLFFTWTEAEGLYKNVAAHVKGVKIELGHKKDYLTSKQVQRLLGGIDRNSLKGQRDYALLALMITSGLREVSIVRADVKDLRPLGDDLVLYFQGKGRTEKADYVKIPAQVEGAIRAYLQARGKCEPDAPLFASIANRNTGGRMTTRSIGRVCKERLLAVGLESDRLTGHSLRHTAATLNLLNGGTLEETQQLLGHRSITTTQIYAHALERAKNQSEDRIANAIFG